MLICRFAKVKSYSMHEVDIKHAKTNELINEHTKIEDYLHVNHGRELQVWTKHLIWYEEPPPGRRLHVQPLTQRPSTPSFDDPQPTVIALDQWTSTLRRPNSPSRGIVDVEPQEHGIF
ncbi:hypothetical protein MUK42_10952 [Musa troglodytarum]|uniref:Uncharacterized protein n=1 Tax=Musa troglodytarum TaxID=320322 RepID=A0A9E7GQ01_9LILI|nr:hypothetical protein MUK42_10952 [Musa troglodytarum]